MTHSLDAQARPDGDEWLRQPVDERTFGTFLPFFAYDAKRALDIRVARVENSDGIRVEVLSYESTPGVRVTARLYHAPGAAAGGPGLVVLHGGTGDGKDSPGQRQLCDHFARAGFTVLAIDLQYFGERATELLRQFTEDEKHEKLYNQPSTYLSWVTQTAKDAGRAVDVLIERGVNSNRVGLVGFSRGAQLAFIAGAVERRFGAVVAVIGGHFDFRETGHLPAACPANYIGRISPRPLLMVNGNADPDYIRATAVEPLERLARDPKEMIWLETGHLLPQGEIRTTIARWLHQQLQR
jgi:dienelactone hydrolase